MRRLVLLPTLSLVLILTAFSVRLDLTPALPATPFDYDGIVLPSYLDVPPVQAEDNTPDANPVTDEGATLGRVLFYDVRLSLNETIACGSCHLQDKGFSDPATISTGFDGGETGRNSMGLAFARYYDNGRFFWDERAATLEDQVLQPIQDHIEMGMTLPDVVARLEATDFYPGLFADAFGTSDVSSERVALALAQFVRSIVSPNTPYDAARQRQGGPPGRPMTGLTDLENQGLTLFFGRATCATCHRGDLFVGDQARNNGLDAVSVDVGAGGGRFKTGSLRNVELTAPYMHDGRFATLEEVVEHYNSGIQNSADLDPRLRGPGGRPIRLNLSSGEKDALVAFLRTLTDPTLADDPRWSDPFADQVSTTFPQESKPVSTLLALAGVNPTRDQTAFRITLDDYQPVRLDVYTADGRHVETLLERTMTGEETVRWDASRLAPGLYFARLTAGNRTATQAVTVVR